MENSADVGGMIVGIVIFIVVAVVMFMIQASQQKAAADPTDPNYATADNLKYKLNLDAGAYRIGVYRQSGNFQREFYAYSADRAVTEIVNSMNKANIYAVRVSRPKLGVVQIDRVGRNDRGRAEGKRIGSYVILAA